MKLQVDFLLSSIKQGFKDISEIELSAVYIHDMVTDTYYHFSTSGGTSTCRIVNKLDGIAGKVFINNQLHWELNPYVSKDTSFIEKTVIQNEHIGLLVLPVSNTVAVLGILEFTFPEDKSVQVKAQQDKIGSLIPSITPLLEMFREQRRVRKIFVGIIRALTSAIDSKEPYMQGHSARVCQYAIILADELGLGPQTKDEVELAALLHDVGKLCIPERVLLKEESLTEEDWAEIKRHPIAGAGLLNGITELVDIIPGVKYHQERFDGQGYPEGLWGDKIPLVARIVAVADTFDAMTSNRPYRRRFPEDVALSELKVFSGFQFDPQCVAAFIRGYERVKHTLKEERKSADELLSGV